MQFAIVGGDRRQDHLAAYLQERGHVVSRENHPWESIEAVILPMPALDAEGFIRGTALRPEDLAQRILPETLVLGGKLQACSHLFARREDYALWEHLAADNARPTAEGAILLAMEAMDSTVEHSRFLVIGAGRIGMALAQKLQALGAEVTVCARREEDFERLEALGLAWDITGRYEKGLSYDGILNTVPAPILTAAQILQTPEHCVLIELASAPYGIGAEDCKASGRQYILGSALPGRFFPKTAGELLARHILAFLHLST